MASTTACSSGVEGVEGFHAQTECVGAGAAFVVAEHE